MPIDPSISMSYRGIEVPNPLNQLAQVSQIQAAQRQGELSQMQLDELKADRLEMQKFQQEIAAKGGNPDLNAYADMLLKSPKHMQMGIELKQKLADQTRFETIGRKMYPELFGTAPETAPAAPAQANALAPTPAAPLNAMVTPTATSAQPLSPSGKTRRELEGVIFMAQQNPLLKGMAETAKLELQEMIKAEAPTELRRDYEYAKKQGFVGTLFDYKRKLAEAGRTPAQPVAPTITQIQDPTDSTRMITVDARRYQGGGLGSIGVIGSSGKTPKAEADRLKQEQGASQAMDILDTLKTAYDELDRMQAVPSEQRGVLANAIAYLGSTGTGQTAGRVMGTKEQTQRDIISSARNQMLNAIKNATGMSAQQLNSNVEFRSWLEALTDPTRSIEANRSILENMENFITSGGKYSAKKNTGATSNTAPAPGTIMDGYRFKGGNPADQSNWEKL